MALYDDLCRIAENSEARPEIANILKRLDLKLFLRFLVNAQGKWPKRVSRAAW